GIHAGWNYFQGNIFGLPVSGIPEASSLFAFGPASGSTDLVTGGSFGVEASIVGTSVLLVAAIIAFLYYRRKEAARAAAQPAASAA
ncbi:MAG: CPBP family intramembrane glutamate endopeptidase, partial [Actinomycetes bacterium]